MGRPVRNVTSFPGGPCERGHGLAADRFFSLRATPSWERDPYGLDAGSRMRWRARGASSRRSSFAYQRTSREQLSALRSGRRVNLARPDGSAAFRARRSRASQRATRARSPRQRSAICRSSTPSMDCSAAVETSCPASTSGSRQRGSAFSSSLNRSFKTRGRSAARVRESSPLRRRDMRARHLPAGKG